MKLRLVYLFGATFIALSCAQPLVVADEPAPDRITPAEDAIEHGLSLLAGVRDNVLSFDDPGFYWFCRYVTRPDGIKALQPIDTDAPLPWKYLFERPGDYRGKPVVIEGLLVARSTWSVDNRDVPRPLHQCEIATRGTSAVATVVTPDAMDDIPLHSTVRVKGYFIKVRAFRTKSGETGAGPLLVSRKPKVLAAGSGPIGPAASGNLDADSPRPGAQLDSAMNWLLGVTAAAALLWLVLRRHARRAPAPITPPIADRQSAISTDETPNDFDWMTKLDQK